MAEDHPTDQTTDKFRTPGEDTPPESRAQSAPPEATNRDHPSAPGQRHAIPGEGLVDEAARSATTKSDDPHAPQMAPGALRPGTTTTSGPAAIPAQGPDNMGDTASAATENFAEGGTASLDTHTASPPPSPGSQGAPEIADPNYTAASPRAIADHDAPAARMDTGHHPQPTPQTGSRRRTARRVRDVMTADVEVCHPGTELYYVARMMAERDCGAIPVVENTDTMKLLGLLTDRDIVTRVLAKRQNPQDLRAGDCMSTGLLTARPDTSLDELIQQMRQRQVRRVPVVDEGGRCIGIVAQADIVKKAPQSKVNDLLKEVSEPPHPGSQGQYH